MTPQTYEIDGTPMTIKQICAKVTALSERTIRRRLQEGARTIRDLLDDSKARSARIAGNRHGGAHWRTFGA
jgi:hypothetical protein